MGWTWIGKSSECWLAELAKLSRFRSRCAFSFLKDWLLTSHWYISRIESNRRLKLQFDIVISAARRFDWILSLLESLLWLLIVSSMGHSHISDHYWVSGMEIWFPKTGRLSVFWKLPLSMLQSFFLPKSFSTQLRNLKIHSSLSTIYELLS